MDTSLSAILNGAENEFKTALAETKTGLVNDGLGLEITAVYDDRFLGRLMKALIDRIADKVFELAELAEAVREVLRSRTNASGETFIGEMRRGALVASEYRKARFLLSIDDAGVVDWVSRFIGRVVHRTYPKE